jgi:uncharacterized protein (DUF58 family)
MPRAVFLGLLIFILLLTGLATLHGGMLSLAVPLLLYLFYGLWRGPDEINLDIDRKLSEERVAPQTPVHVEVTIKNQGGDLEELAIEDILSSGLKVVEGSNHHLVSLPKGGTYTFGYTVRGLRGGFQFEYIHVEVGDHTGVLRGMREFRILNQLFVFPTIVRIKHIPIRPRRTRVYAGSIPARIGGSGVEFFGVRDYQEGDPPRHINWQVSARHVEDLFSNEFQQERVADVGIVLDGRVRSNMVTGGHSLFEHSVLAAGALADAFLMQGNRVGLLVYSQYLGWTWPGYGKLQRERILYALSHAATGASQIFDGLQYLPSRMFPVESQIVLVSPLVEDDYVPLIQLRARGYQVMVVSPDPVTFELSHLSDQPDVRLAARVVRMERKLMIHRIQRAGVQVYEWDVSEPFDQAAHHFFGRRLHKGDRL